jgi:hypothetical protein
MVSRFCISPAFFHCRYTPCASNAGMPSHLIRNGKKGREHFARKKKNVKEEISEQYVMGRNRGAVGPYKQIG